MATLYRKYRPQNFKETLGQNPIKITLENQVQSDNFAHSYLFCGPRAVGKTTLARVFAKAINCLNRSQGEADPCNKCDSCLEINKGSSLDIVEIDAASHTGVDNVRENIIAASRVGSSRSKFKVFIIDEVHMLSVSAFNALLKVLEEPPANVVFVLCTTEVHKMPTTIISRCQRFDFRLISVKDIVGKLEYIVNQEGIEVDREVLESVARQSGGHMRDAESLLGQVVAISGKKITQKEADLVIPRSDIQEILNLIDLLIKKDASSGIALVNNLVNNGVDLKSFIDDLIEVLRKMMINKISPGLSEKIGLELGESLDAKLDQISQETNLNQLVKILEKFIIVRNSLKTSFIIQLPVELALVDLCSEEAGGGTGSRVKESRSNKEDDLGGNRQVPQKEDVENKKGKDVDLDRQEISSRWNEVLAGLKKHNHSLSFILKVCQVKEVKDGIVSLSFKHKFHKDRLSEAKIKDLVEKTLTEIFGCSLSINPLVEEEIDTGEDDTGGGEAQKKEGDESVNSDDNCIDDILKTFGGKVIK